MLSCLAAGLVLFGCCHYKTISVVSNNIVSPGYYLLNSLVGWVFLYSIASMLNSLQPGVVKGVIVHIGKSSLFILMLHIFIWMVMNILFAKVLGVEAVGLDQFSSTLVGGVVYIAVGISLPVVVFEKVYQPFLDKICNVAKFFR